MATLRQLEYFTTVVETGSFTRASELLHVSQPALSHQIRALERSIGGPLLERLPRAIRLTPLGRAVLPHALSSLADMTRLHAVARRTNSLEDGELEIAVTYSMSLGLLPAVLKRWHGRHPGVRIRLREHSHTDQLQASMTAGAADLAVGPEPENWDGPVYRMPDEEFVVVLPADDPLASSDSDALDLALLADRDWVHYTPDNGLAEFVDTVCIRAGFRPRAAVRAEQTATAPLLAAAGLGPALVPAAITGPGFDGAMLRPHPPVRRRIAAYTRHNPDPLATAFVAFLAEHHGTKRARASR